MATLHVIGEFLTNWEERSLVAASNDLTVALADAAPRGYGSNLLIAANTEPPTIDHPKTRVSKMSIVSGVLPLLWLSSTAARPLDSEFVHALSPLAPLRTRDEDDGSQATVTVPHTLAWDAPEALPKGQARVIRKFTRRALKHADVIVTSTHAACERLREIYGSTIPIQVAPLATPHALRAGDDAAERRRALNLPERYVVTNAFAGKHGRLDWLLNAYTNDESLPTLVLICAAAETDPAMLASLGDRVIVLDAELEDIGAAIAGATAFAMPQSVGDNLLTVYAALASRVPIVHAGAESIVETVLDAALIGTEEESFMRELRLVLDDKETRERLAVLASDQSRMYSWGTTAWQLWEIHANI